LMPAGQTVDGVLVQWGERLFYPPTRIVKPQPTPRLDTLVRRKAAVIRGRIVATVTRRAPQVMVKVTGGGRGMAAIAAHLRYISKNGRLSMEDDRGVVRDGKESLLDLTDQWRHGGALIPEEGHRREALNIMLSMPRGTDAKIVQCAAREFAAAELAGHCGRRFERVDSLPVSKCRGVRGGIGVEVALAIRARAGFRPRREPDRGSSCLRSERSRRGPAAGPAGLRSAWRRR
jgi:hypothetical protein